MLRFTKMNGAGNDFVMIDNRLGDVALTPGQIARVCDRHRGVGADGILLLERASNGADFRMRYYNADGGEAEMCGNGARCFARYADRVAGPREAGLFEKQGGGGGGATLGGDVPPRVGGAAPLQTRGSPPLGGAKGGRPFFKKRGG